MRRYTDPQIMALDLLIKNGLVIDGTGAPGRRADVRLVGGRILDVDEDLTVAGIAESIDATGLVVAPGFIDTHAHSDLMVLADPDLPMKVRQGVTLDVLGQDGLSDRKSTRLNSSHIQKSRMPSSA